MTKFICIALVLACMAVSAHAQFQTNVQCTSFNDCVCKLPAIIGAVAGRTATANIRNPANGETYVLDLSKPSQAVANYCNQLKQGLKPAVPFKAVNGAKIAQVQALLAQRLAGLRG
ncbi:uncharacterized protein LOC126559460 [Anopheles maculipalpis]|uniref:uncharacterized protein LOC126559460 n=1 Tax=Anopheles maculipalpis TaxID=1496333 RepID=UPI00215989E4|nr:uncharacterized protein LOC126559460 [Anopheles maculipalpis]